MQNWWTNRENVDIGYRKEETSMSPYNKS